MILAGGTGGHVMPALAVAQCLQEQGVSVHWLGTRAGIEARLVTQSGIPLTFIDIQGIRGKKWLSWVLAPFRIAKAFIQSAQVLIKERPNVILSMGGYVAGPAALMGFFLGKPLVVHEQNAVAGTTNRILAKFARKIMVAFPNVFSSYTSKVIFTGNPVRKEIIAIPEPSQRQHSATQPLRVLILGGSQGAAILNETLPAAFAMFAPEQRPTITHQCGRGKSEKTQAEYDRCGVKVNVCEFIDDMAAAYANADVVICRSGALTVAEIAATGVASILIPFPYAIDDHQTGNAKYLTESNAAIFLPQSALSAQKVHELLAELQDNPQKRLEMAIACRQLAKPKATEEVANYCLGAMSG